MNVSFKSTPFPESLIHHNDTSVTGITAEVKLVLVVTGTVKCASVGFAWHLSPVTSLFSACACPKGSLLLEECCSMALRELGRP